MYQRPLFALLCRMTFAFLVHPRVALREDMARIWRPLGVIPNQVYDRALRRLPLPPVTFAQVQLTDSGSAK